MFSSVELKRYTRHLTLSEIGITGQEKLKKASVLIIGAGGLGCPALQYLVAAGVGHIGIIDDDLVEESNLQRQILYSTSDVGKYKVEAAQQKLAQQNPHIKITALNARLKKVNVLSIIKDYDVIVDGSDNFSTRYLVNDACVMVGKPLVFGAIFKFEGQVSVFNYQGSATYRCLYPEPPSQDEVPNCSEIGVLGVLPGIVGCLQANEALKIILGIGEVLSNKLLIFNSLTMNFQTFSIKPNLKNLARNKLEDDYEEVCALPIKEITVADLKSKIENKEKLQIIDVREEDEYEICNLGGTLIPLSTIKNNLHLIKQDYPVVFHCHHGSRSKQAIEMLNAEVDGRNFYNLKGGIHQWALQIDTTMPTY